LQIRWPPKASLAYLVLCGGFGQTQVHLHGFRFIIHYISTFTTLVPGDVIVTGTPTGAGARFDPPRYLKPGDVVEVEAENIGVLRNGVVDEA